MEHFEARLHLKPPLTLLTMSKKYFERLAKTGGTSSKAFESDFGKRILMKYGWKEGEGLGRNSEGSSECLQAVRREDNKGLGAESQSTKKEWENWWADCFNSVAKKIVVPQSGAAASNSAGDDDSSSSDDDEPTQGGRVTAVKGARHMAGKIRRVVRQERPQVRSSTPASPAAGPTKRSAPEDLNGAKRLRLDE